MSVFYTPSLLITDYYDSLISQLDIYTEERIKEHKEKGLPQIDSNNSNGESSDSDEESSNETRIQKFENRSLKYKIDRNKFPIETKLTQVEDYLNEVRQKAIDEIRKVQDEILNYYNDNKDKFKLFTEDNLDELKSNLFANRFCFLVNIKTIGIKCWETAVRNNSLFKLHTVITNFYLSESDIEPIRREFDSNYDIKHTTTEFNQRFLLANQLREYIKETCYGYSNGCEIIQVEKKTLFEIENIEIEPYKSFKDANLRIDNDIDLSAIKSLCMITDEAKLSDLSVFGNIEYLSISDTKIFDRPFKNLNKLIKIELENCDLAEFDFNSINWITSLEILEMSCENSNKELTFKLNLNQLINLKSLSLNSIQVELISETLNQLTKLKLCHNSFDFSRQIEFPELKCLDISHVDLSQQINIQWFNGMIGLIELNLNHTNLKEVDFISTEKLQNLEILDLSNNCISVLRNGVFSKLKSLKSLNLDYNRIQELNRGTFEGPNRIECLEISLSGFDILPIDKTVFIGLNSLKYLHVREFDSRNREISHFITKDLNLNVNVNNK